MSASSRRVASSRACTISSTLRCNSINVNNGEFIGELENSAVSLAELCGRPVDLAGLTTTFLAKLACNFGILLAEEELFLREGHFSGREGHLLLQRWLALSDSIAEDPDIVTDFNFDEGDLLDFTQVAGVEGTQQLSFAGSGDGVDIIFSGGVLHLTGFSGDQVQGTWFVFGNWNL